MGVAVGGGKNAIAKIIQLLLLIVALAVRFEPAAPAVADDAYTSRFVVWPCIPAWAQVPAGGPAQAPVLHPAPQLPNLIVPPWKPRISTAGSLLVLRLVIITLGAVDAPLAALALSSAPLFPLTLEAACMLRIGSRCRSRFKQTFEEQKVFRNRYRTSVRSR